MPFDPAVRQQLAAEVAGFCSAPHCRSLAGIPGVPGYGPNFGDGAHIAGSAPTAPRHDGDLDIDVRESAANGIWLCPTCHRKADRFPDQYPADLLHRWKEDTIAWLAHRRLNPSPPVGFADLTAQFETARAFLDDQQKVRAELLDLWRAWPAPFTRGIVVSEHLASEVNHFFVPGFGRLTREDYHWCFEPMLRAMQWELGRLLLSVAHAPQFRARMTNREVSFAFTGKRPDEAYPDPAAAAVVCYLSYFDEFSRYVFTQRVPNFGQLPHRSGAF
jgi:hypothetical protein